MRKGKEMALRVLILLLGLTIAHLGVTLFLQAELGSDPFNVLVQGIFRSLSALSGAGFLTHGRTHMGISFLIILVLLAVDRSYVKIGTILCMFAGGPIIDFFTFFLRDLFNRYDPMWVRITGLALGCIILAFGMTIVIQSDAGTGPNDLVAIVIADKTGKKFSLVRILVDLTFVTLGFALGGTVGLGTMICAFLVGPAAGIFLPINKRWIDRVIVHFCPAAGDF